MYEPSPSQEPVPEPPPRRGIPLPLHEVRVTPLLIGLNVVIFLIETVMGGSSNVCTLIFFGAKFNYLIQTGEYWRLGTAMFLHIGLLHLGFNQYALWIFGREVERLFGSGRFLAVYMLSGLLASVTSMMLNSSISAGASGAIFGVVGTQLAFLFRNRDRFGEFGRQQAISLLAIVGLNILLGITLPGIDNWNHMGGLVSGAVLGLIVAPRYELERSLLTVRVEEVNPFTRTIWVVVVVAVLLAVTVPVLAPRAPTRPDDTALVRLCRTRGLGGRES